jgi:uncharacterized membrane protein
MRRRAGSSCAVDEDSGRAARSAVTVTTLVAVAFPYESTASAAAEDVRRLVLDIRVDPDAVAVVSRDRAGAYQMTTSHGPGGDTRWGVFWVLLCETLFGSRLTDTGRSDGARPRGRPDHAVDDSFRRHLRDLLTPGTSALLLAVDGKVSQHAVRELTRLGGILVTWGLTADARRLVEGALSGMAASRAGGHLWPGDDSLPWPAPAAAVAQPQPGQSCGSV